MIIVLQAHAGPEAVLEVERHVKELGYLPHTIRGEVRTVVACIGDETTHGDLHVLEALPCVDRVVAIQKRYKLVSREMDARTTRFSVAGVEIGGDTFQVIAGPCSVESYEQMIEAARAVKAGGGTLLRGGAFKPRTSPYDFQGLGEEGIRILEVVRRETGMPIVSEVLRASDIDRMAEVVDVLQIGARNALNYALLEAVAKAGRPIFLKRGLASTIEEWLLAAEYLAKNGNSNIMLCERGIRTFETATRNTLDLSAAVLALQETCLPIFVDPSHAAGRRDLIPSLACAAAAIGSHGLMIEVHAHPETAYSDQTQQLTAPLFTELMQRIAPFVRAAGRRMATDPTEQPGGVTT